MGQGKRNYAAGIGFTQCSGVSITLSTVWKWLMDGISVLLYLLNHPIPHRFAEPLGGRKRFPWVIFGITNLILARSRQMLHILSNSVRVFPLIAQNLFQERFQ